MSTEIRVGICFLLGLSLLASSTFVIEDISLFEKPGKEYQVYFPEVVGLSTSDSVLYGGLEVGEITGINIEKEKNLVLVRYTVRYEYIDYVQIREDSLHRIGSDLFGRANLSISFGTLGAKILEPGQRPIGKKPTDLGQVLNTAGEILDETKGLPSEIKKLTISLTNNQEKLLMSAYKILEDNQANLKRTIDNITNITTAISSAGGTVGRLIMEDGLYKKADKAMDKVNSIGDEFDRMGKKLNEIIQENRRNIKKITDNLADASPNLEKTIRSISGILEENRENLKKIMDDFSEATPKINKSLYDLNIMTGKMARGEALLGSIIMDDEFKETIDTTIMKIGDAASELSSFTSRVNKLQTFLGLDWQTNTLERSSRANLYLRIAPSASKEYLIGGTFYINYPELATGSELDWREGSFDEMTFTFLLGWRFFNDAITFKVGAIESVVGSVFEYSFLHYSPDTDEKTGQPAASSITSIRLEARAMDNDYEDFETEMMLRMLIRHNFGNGIIIQAGADNLFNTPRFLFGFVFEYKDEDIKYVVSM